jgi:ABC-2 type transport system ATP-binding protein
MTTILHNRNLPIPGRPRADQSHALEIEHVTKRYGANTVVDDLSFTVQPGRVTGFLGPNGAGKSTTMKILLGLAAADRGKATIGGCRYRELPDPAGTVGVVIEADAFHPGRSGRNHLRILADATGITPARVGEMLELVGLAEAADRRVGGYSLGMRQRLGLAAALLGDPPVLVLDEPGNGLDPQGIRALRDLLRSRTANGDTVFVSSHLLAEVEHLADDVIVINRGKFVTSGSLSELQQTASLVRTASADTLKPVLESAGGVAQLQDHDTLVVRGLPIDEIGERAFHAGIALHELSPHAGSLEELFLNWTSGEMPSDSSHIEKEVVRP